MSKSWIQLGFGLLILGAGSLLLNSPTFLFAWVALFLTNLLIQHCFDYPTLGIHACDWLSTLIDEAAEEHKQTNDAEKFSERIESINFLIEAYTNLDKETT